MAKMMITDLDLNDKKVLMRLDFNVPIQNGKVADGSRVIAALPTIKYVIAHHGKSIIFAHLGRINTEADKKGKSLEPVAKYLSKQLDQPVIFVPVNEGKQLEDAINKMKDGDVLLAENTRFQDVVNGKHIKREHGNDPKLGQYWASLGDCFINDAFGTAHRKHASNVGIATAMKKAGKPVAAGFLMQKEIKYLGNAVKNPKRPFVAILGGAKVSDKIGVINNLIPKVDKVIIAGDGANLCFRNIELENCTLADDDRIYQNAVGVAKAAQNKNAIFPKALMPVYLRQSQAERELKLKLKR